MLKEKDVSGIEANIERHYARGGLTDRILAVLQNAGRNINTLSYSDLWPLDQFHMRGRDATVELAQLAGLGAGMRVLDVGCGIGGPARLLAAEFGCAVTGIDLTEEFCEAATRLSELVKLSGKVEFRCANALDLPFEPAGFDAVWTQHASMNISDKDRLYSEFHRVLKPGGRVCIYDIAAGPASPIHFPVPWARDPSISFLIAPDVIRRKLEDAGFRVIAWQDGTGEAMSWFQAMADRKPVEDEQPRLGMHLLQGPVWPVMIANVGRNLAEQRLEAVRAVLEKPL